VTAEFGVATASGRRTASRAPDGLAAPGSALDAESARWLASLREGDPRRDSAVRALHELLLRAAHWQVRRSAHLLADIAEEDLDALAGQAADDAVMAVLGKLDDYAGRSKFTTWVFKFAILHASVAVRRTAWRHREIPTDAQEWPYTPIAQDNPAEAAEAAELAAALRVAIDERLTPHQHDVVVALAINEVPIDVLAERLGTTRGALYKTLHDARARLRKALEEKAFVFGPARGGDAR
jgi:RNA polymerase sigma-70 factor (ECF subfamily)